MIKYVEMKGSEAKDLMSYVKESNLECSLYVSKAHKGLVFCKIEASEDAWNVLKTQLRKKQLLFDYYGENNESIASPFKQIV